MADMGLTEVTAVAMTEVSSYIQTELKQRAVLMNTVQNFIALPGRKAIDIGRAGSLAAETKAENTALTAQVLTYVADTLALDAHKAILVRLEDRAAIQATPDVVEDILKRMATEMALEVDELIEAQLQLTSAAAPDHRIAYVGATLAQADILAARTLLHTQNVPFEECFIGVSPTSESALLAIADFVRADAYGNASGLQKGQLGTLYGAKVIMSNVFDTAATLVWHPTHVAFGMQASIKFETARDLPNLANEYAASSLFGAKVLDSGKRGVLLGSAA